ncbi:MAG: hypothetical protein U0517_02650 [Candidatus Andersenbacteria bacterium]
MNTKRLLYIGIAAIACLAAGPIYRSGWYDAEDKLGRTVVTFNSGYPQHELVRNGLAYKSDGTMCAIWLAKAGKDGSHVCYGCYDKVRHCMVGEKDPFGFDVVFDYGRSRPIALIMGPGDIATILAVEAPVLQSDPPTPERLKVARFNQATGNWEGWRGTGFDLIAQQSCAGQYECSQGLKADAARNPTNNWFGVAWMDGLDLHWIDFDGTNYLDAFAYTNGNWVQPAVQIDQAGTPHVALAGMTITGRGAGIDYATRSGSTWTHDWMSGATIVSGDLAVSSTGDVMEAFGTYYYPDTSTIGLRLKPAGGSWQNIPMPFQSKPGAFAIRYDPAGRLVLVWYERDLKDLYAARRLTTGVWVGLEGGSAKTRVTTDPYENNHLGVTLNVAGLPGVIYRIGAEYQFPDLGYTHWIGP